MPGLVFFLSAAPTLRFPLPLQSSYYNRTSRVTGREISEIVTLEICSWKTFRLCDGLSFYPTESNPHAERSNDIRADPET